MNKNNLKLLIKGFIIIFLLLLMAVSARRLYLASTRAYLVNEKMVESYRPSLNSGLIKTAVGALRGE